MPEKSRPDRHRRSQPATLPGGDQSGWKTTDNGSLLRSQENAADRHPEGGREEVAAARRRMGNRDTERPAPARTLYAYATNTTIPENILLPRTMNCTLETIVCLPEGMKATPRTNKEISNACGKVVFSYQPTKEGIKVTRSLRISRQLQTPSNYKELYALRQNGEIPIIMRWW